MGSRIEISYSCRCSLIDNSLTAQGISAYLPVVMILEGHTGH